jgi:hypothetical protein
VYSILSHGRVTHCPGLYKAGVSLQGYLLISSIKCSLVVSSGPAKGGWRMGEWSLTGTPFNPFSMKTYGRLGRPAMELLHKLGKEAAGTNGVLRASFVARTQRELSIGVCRGNFFHVSCQCGHACQGYWDELLGRDGCSRMNLSCSLHSVSGIHFPGPYLCTCFVLPCFSVSTVHGLTICDLERPAGTRGSSAECLGMLHVLCKGR